jgi:hypothetical protein
LTDGSAIKCLLNLDQTRSNCRLKISKTNQSKKKCNDTSKLLWIICLLLLIDVIVDEDVRWDLEIVDIVYTVD